MLSENRFALFGIMLWTNRLTLFAIRIPAFRIIGCSAGRAYVRRVP